MRPTVETQELDGIITKYDWWGYYAGTSVGYREKKEDITVEECFDSVIEKINSIRISVKKEAVFSTCMFSRDISKLELMKRNYLENIDRGKRDIHASIFVLAEVKIPLNVLTNKKESEDLFKRRVIKQAYDEVQAYFQNDYEVHDGINIRIDSFRHPDVNVHQDTEITVSDEDDNILFTEDFKHE